MRDYAVHCTECIAFNLCEIDVALFFRACKRIRGAGAGLPSQTYLSVLGQPVKAKIGMAPADGTENEKSVRQLLRMMREALNAGSCTHSWVCVVTLLRRSGVSHDVIDGDTHYIVYDLALKSVTAAATDTSSSAGGDCGGAWLFGRGHQS